MILRPVVSSLAVLLLAAPALAQGVLIAPGPPAGPPMIAPGPPPRAPHMTSDSAEYCAYISAEAARVLRAHPQAPPDARMLAEEGNRLCAQAHFRAGVMRLRRAVRIARNGF